MSFIEDSGSEEPLAKCNLNQNEIYSNIKKTCSDVSTRLLQSLLAQEKEKCLGQKLITYESLVKDKRNELAELKQEISDIENKNQVLSNDYDKVLGSAISVIDQEGSIIASIKRHTREALDSFEEYNRIETFFTTFSSNLTSSDNIESEIYDKACKLKQILAGLVDKKESLVKRRNEMTEINKNNSQLPAEVEQLTKEVESVRNISASLEAQAKAKTEENNCLIAKRGFLCEQIASKTEAIKSDSVALENLKLKLEQKRTSESKANQMFQEKLRQIENFSLDRFKEIKQKLDNEVSAHNEEIDKILQRNKCLQESYDAKLKTQKDMEKDLMSLKAKEWEIHMNPRKKNWLEELESIKTRIREKKTQIKSVRGFLDTNEQLMNKLQYKPKSYKELTDFKKPTPLKTASDILFDQLRDSDKGSSINSELKRRTDLNMSAADSVLSISTIGPMSMMVSNELDASRFHK